MPAPDPGRRGETVIEGRPFRWWELVPAVLVVAICVIGIVQALRFTDIDDLGLAYTGGQEAWASGHPERVSTWISTPFLGMAMALVSRVLSVTTATFLLTIVNLAIVLAGIGLTWWRLRARLAPLLWWSTLLAALVFAPIASTLWWKQFNIVALGLAAAGFMWSRQGRSIGPAALIALSIAIKPIVILLPLALLIRSESRKTGWWAIGWIVGLMALAQAFLAWRARNLRDLSPIPALQTFLERPIQWACHPENYSPYSLVCRASGGQYFSWQRLVTTAGVLLLILMAVDVIRGHPGRSWVIFAFACLLSPMVSPIAWSHYQILLLPMFVLLAAEFALRGASMIQWLSVAAAYLLAELTWRPLGTLVGAFRYLFSGQRENIQNMYHVMAVAEFAQYVLLIAALIWFASQRRQAAKILA